MKKFICIFTAILATVTIVFGFGCSKKSVDAVNLVAIDGTQVGVMSDIDYYVVPEPAASAKVKAIEGLEFCGSLQELYGEGNGYPQAVVVVKNNLLGTKKVADILAGISECKQWLSAEGTSIETIVQAVSSHLTEGMQPSFSSKNLTKEVISNCGINYVSAADSKTEINAFMNSVNGVATTSFGMPDEEFFWNGQGGAEEYSEKISVYAPDGAPALAIANLLAGAKSVDNVNYEVVNANTIQVYVTGAAPKADICVLPVNLAVKLLGSGGKYKMAATLTHGNLYIVSNCGTKITASNLAEALSGKTVGVVNLAAVPGLTFKAILANKGIKYSEPIND